METTNNKIEIGSKYKEAMNIMSNGYGKYAWSTSTYLFINELPIWLKICEICYKNTRKDGIVHLKSYWLSKYFAEDGGSAYVDLVLNSLHNIGYIDVQYSEDGFVDISVNYETVSAATHIVGKDRPYAMKLRKACQTISNAYLPPVDKNILEITPSEMLKARSK